jgi:hypothetical protein
VIHADSSVQRSNLLCESIASPNNGVLSVANVHKRARVPGGSLNFVDFQELFSRRPRNHSDSPRVLGRVRTNSTDAYLAAQT